MAKTDVAVQSGGDIVLNEQAELEASLAAQNQADLDSADIQVPLLKIGQALTDEVVNGDASAGEFINSLTREGLGGEIEFIVAGYTKGRFDHGDRNRNIRARKAFGTNTVPWSDDPHYGASFSEHPDAEEQYAERVNRGDIEWGRGPRISTTYDFTGYVISGLGEDEEPIPVCLSLMRMNRRAARKWVTLLDAVLRGRYWDAVFELSTERQSGEQGTYYTVNVRQLRKTTPEEKQRAVQLAVRLRNQNVEVVGEAEDRNLTSEPKAEGALAV